MKISEKINLDYDGLVKYGPVNIVVFGDSVTHGAFSPGEFDYENVYWNVLRNKIIQKRPYVPVNVINAAIGGITAKQSAPLTEERVLSHNPDLVIVCFGLNDVNGTLEDYIDSLKIIFAKIQNTDSELIFLTPNMLNTYVAKDTSEQFVKYAHTTSQFQNDGKMDTFISSAINLARSMNVNVCDCYSEWKKLSKECDTTMLLANRINHPNQKMHRLFADRLYEMLFPCEIETNATDSAMYCK